MGDHKDKSLVDVVVDPRAFVLSLIGAEALTPRGEDGPLARPFRAVPRGMRRAGDHAVPSSKPDNEEGSRG